MSSSSIMRTIVQSSVSHNLADEKISDKVVAKSSPFFIELEEKLENDDDLSDTSSPADQKNKASDNKSLPPLPSIINLLERWRNIEAEGTLRYEWIHLRDQIYAHEYKTINNPNSVFTYNSGTNLVIYNRANKIKQIIDGGYPHQTFYQRPNGQFVTINNCGVKSWFYSGNDYKTGYEYLNYHGYLYVGGAISPSGRFVALILKKCNENNELTFDGLGANTILRILDFNTPDYVINYELTRSFQGLDFGDDYHLGILESKSVYLLQLDYAAKALKLKSVFEIQEGANGLLLYPNAQYFCLWKLGVSAGDKQGYVSICAPDQKQANSPKKIKKLPYNAMNKPQLLVDGTFFFVHYDFKRESGEFEDCSTLSRYDPEHDKLETTPLSFGNLPPKKISPNRFRFCLSPGSTDAYQIFEMPFTPEYKAWRNQCWKQEVDYSFHWYPPVIKDMPAPVVTLITGYHDLYPITEQPPVNFTPPRHLPYIGSWWGKMRQQVSFLYSDFSNELSCSPEDVFRQVHVDAITYLLNVMPEVDYSHTSAVKKVWKKFPSLPGDARVNWNTVNSFVSTISFGFLATQREERRMRDLLDNLQKISDLQVSRFSLMK